MGGGGCITLGSVVLYHSGLHNEAGPLTDLWVPNSQCKATGLNLPAENKLENDQRSICIVSK